MSPGLTMERVYDALKALLMSGALLPRQRLDPARLAADLNTSTTPVRDALHRLMGERLVEGWPHEGFQVPVISEARLRDLYLWNQTLLTTCLKQPIGARSFVRDPGGDDQASGDEAQRVAGMFADIARRSGSDEWHAAISNASDRLHALRHAEARVFYDLETELEALQACLEEPAASLHQAIVRYHRRRIRAVAAICTARGTR